MVEIRTEKKKHNAGVVNILDYNPRLVNIYDPRPHKKGTLIRVWGRIYLSAKFSPFSRWFFYKPGLVFFYKSRLVNLGRQKKKINLTKLTEFDPNLIQISNFWSEIMLLMLELSFRPKKIKKETYLLIWLTGVLNHLSSGLKANNMQPG